MRSRETKNNVFKETRANKDKVIEELKNEVKSVVMNAFNSNDKDFDENTILSPLNTRGCLKNRSNCLFLLMRVICIVKNARNTTVFLRFFP